MCIRDRAPEVHICMAPEAKDVIITLIKDCNDTYEVLEHKRDTELIFEDKKFDLNKDVKPGDALVVLGKKKALAVSAQLLNNNIKTSIIYGSLPYSTRKKQFERFLDGETEVIVCTDAIGMGVNLPIKRIVFLETRKYDGVSLRKLNVSEIKQIAGRAGRKGIYNKGYVATMSDPNSVSYTHLDVYKRQVYLNGGFFNCNIYIKNGVITNITNEDLGCKVEENASGKLVLPGFIDPHVHFSLGVGSNISSDDFYTGSIKGVLGGVTTYIDFLDPIKSVEEIEEAYKNRMKLAEKSVSCLLYTSRCV